MMPQVCTICSHEDRCEIDRALVGGTAKRRIAADFSVSESAVWRHFREHLPELLSRAYEAEQAAEADKLLTDISRIHVRTLVMLQEAEKSGDLRTALAAVREARNNISLLAELRGQLDRRPPLNLQVNAEWIEVRSAIVQALEPYSGAREAVVRAIRKASNASD